MSVRPAPQAASRSGVIYPPRPDGRPGPPPGGQPGPYPVASPPAASPPPASQPGAPQPDDGSPAKPGTALVLRSEAAASRTPGTPGTPAEALAEFAKDLRDLRSKAGLGYPEMAELSHYTMKTLASAAGGVKLPTLPVTAAYVRACGGNVAEWEDRWHDVAALVEPAGDRPESQPERAHGAPAETAPAGPGNGEPGGPGGAGGARDGEPGEDPRRRTPPPEAGPRTSPGPGPQRPPSRGPEQVYVITSAAPKRPYR